MCKCACQNANNAYSGCGSPFIDDGSWLEVVLNQVVVPYGFVDGRDTLTFTMTAVVGSATSDILLTPLTTLAAMQTATGLSSLTQRGQMFFIGSTTVSDPTIATANGLFEIVGMPTAWKDTYVIRPKSAFIELGGCRRHVTTLGLYDLIQVLYAAPTVKPCVSGNNVYYEPGNQGNFANAVIYQITAVSTTGTPPPQPWTVSATPYMAILGYKIIKATPVPNNC